LVDIGQRLLCKINEKLEPGTRVTVRVFKKKEGFTEMKGSTVPRSTPRERTKIPSWGYTVRLAKGLDRVLKDCPWSEGYDLTIGTSKKGFDAQVKGVELYKFKHLMVVFGGDNGLENAVIRKGEGDEVKLLTEPAKYFNYYINTCFHQGSETIRTEEAILVSLSVLWPHIRRAGVR
jgi:predicted SPOUT superfamily RNA methylase MTH1